METESRSPRKANGGLSWFMVIVLVAGAFLVGSFWNKIQTLEKQVADLNGGGTTNNAGTNVAPPAGNNPPAAAGAPQLGSAGAVDPVTDKDHIKGNAKAEIMVIEYSDIQCPFCKQFHPTLQRAMTEYKDKIAWVYRHYPLTQIHPDAMKAAEATECVAELGGNDKFWTYLDKLFTSSAGLATAQLSSAAVEVGVNKASFESCLNGGKYATKVNEHLSSGQKAGVTGTPGTVILRVKDGKTILIPGAYPYEQVKQSIDQMLSS